jgi:hypothetical protein
MLGFRTSADSASPYIPDSIADDLASIQEQLRALEGRVGHLTRNGFREVADSSREVGGNLAAALWDLAKGLRSRAESSGADAARMGNDALRQLDHLDDDLIRTGRDVVRRVEREVEEHPLALAATAIVVGFGIAYALFGTGRAAPAPARAPRRRRPPARTAAARTRRR